jgi:hypothetical protein
MDLERNFILLNVINKSSCIYAALKEELKIIHNEENKTFINDTCNYLVSSVNNSKGLKAQLSNLLIDKNNVEIYNFCHKLLKYT